MMMKKLLPLLSILIIINLSALGQTSFGDATLFNEGWKFKLGNHPEAVDLEFNDSGWRNLNLPHDWSVEGTYSPDLASCTGYLPGGIGWYRKKLFIPAEKKDQKVYIYFEGIYRNGEIFINGKSLGMRPNGYISYMHELTPYINFGETNLIAVKVDHSDSADSRWYTGSGIYRDVYLVYANAIHINQWGVYYTTPKISKRTATVQV